MQHTHHGLRHISSGDERQVTKPAWPDDDDDDDGNGDGWFGPLCVGLFCYAVL